MHRSASNCTVPNCPFKHDARRLFPHGQYGAIEVQAKAASGRYMSLMVPSAMVLCPCCNGRSKDIGGCELCDRANAIELVAADFLLKYPKIAKAMRRYDLEAQRDAWERHGERVWGC